MVRIKLNPIDFKLEELEPALDVLKRGGVIAYPTETVYGLGADIYDEEAVRRIFQIKRRETGKPFPIIIKSNAVAKTLCAEISELAFSLIQRFWPGPLTLILKAADQVPDYLIGKDKKIGLRIPDHPITKTLLGCYPNPLISTSANISGGKAATRAREIDPGLADKVDLIIDGGICEMQNPSTVLDVTDKKPKLLREGAIPFSMIEQKPGEISYKRETANGRCET